MNENGWGFKDFILIFAIIFLALLVTVAIYEINFNKEDATKPIDPEAEEEVLESYDEKTLRLKVAAQRYQNNNYQSTLESTETWVLDYDLLKKEGYLKKGLYDNLDSSSECTGYVVFNKNGSSISYSPFLKCKNFITDGYDSSRG